MELLSGSSLLAQPFSVYITHRIYSFFRKYDDYCHGLDMETIECNQSQRFHVIMFFEMSLKMYDRYAAVLLYTSKNW